MHHTFFHAVLVVIILFSPQVSAVHWFAINATATTESGCGTAAQAIGVETTVGSEHPCLACTGWTPGNHSGTLSLFFPPDAFIGNYSKIRIFGSWPAASSFTIHFVGTSFSTDPGSSCVCGFVDVPVPDILIGTQLKQLDFVYFEGNAIPSKLPKTLIQAVALESGCGGNCQHGFCNDNPAAPSPPINDNDDDDDALYWWDTDDSSNPSAPTCSCFPGYMGQNCSEVRSSNMKNPITIQKGQMAFATAACGNSASPFVLDIKHPEDRVDFLVYMNSGQTVEVCLSPTDCKSIGPFENLRVTTRVICGSGDEQSWMVHDGCSLRQLPPGKAAVLLRFPNLDVPDDSCTPIDFAVTWDTPLPRLFSAIFSVVGGLVVLMVGCVVMWDRMLPIRVKAQDAMRTSAQAMGKMTKSTAIVVFNLYQKIRTASFIRSSRPETDNDDVPKCRVCYEVSQPLISPCECRGSMQWVHHGCLRRWLLQSSRSDSVIRCELCRSPYHASVLGNPNRIWAIRAVVRARTIVMALIKAALVWVILSTIMQFLLTLLHSLMSVCVVNIVAGYSSFFGSALVTYFCVHMFIKSWGWFVLFWQVPVSVVGIVLSVSLITIVSTCIKLVAWRFFDMVWLPGFPWYSEICILCLNFGAAVIWALVGRLGLHGRLVNNNNNNNNNNNDGQRRRQQGEEENELDRDIGENINNDIIVINNNEDGDDGDVEMGRGNHAARMQHNIMATGRQIMPQQQQQQVVGDGELYQGVAAAVEIEMERFDDDIHPEPRDVVLAQPQPQPPASLHPILTAEVD